MKTGDVLEHSWWMTGTEDDAFVAKFAADAKEAFATVAKNEGFTLEQPIGYELRPGDPRTPPVPDHISGPAVTLMVIECQVGEKVHHLTKVSRFTDELDKADLKRLLKITYGAARKIGRQLTRAEALDAVNEVGEIAALELLRGSATIH